MNRLRWVVLFLFNSGYQETERRSEMQSSFISYYLTHNHKHTCTNQFTLIYRIFLTCAPQKKKKETVLWVWGGGGD